MNNERIHKTFITAVVFGMLILTGFSAQIKVTKASALDHLQALGYSQQEAFQLVTFSNMYRIGREQESLLIQELEFEKSVLEQEIGLPFNESLDVEDLNALEKINFTRQFNEQNAQYYQTLINDANVILERYGIFFDLEEDMTLVQKSELLNNQVQTIINDLRDTALSLGALPSQVENMITHSNYDTVEALETAINQMKEEQKNQGYQFDRNGAMAMFNQVNEYRARQGLPLYAYNYDQQSCVDAEAVAYANTNIPHNWVCKTVANENAGIASVNSDYVKIAMNFFIADPPHHAVLVGNYRSAAVSIVIKEGRAYMILDVFN